MTHRIETEHAGHKLHYSENEDVWRCSELDCEAKTLSALRTKVNKVLADARKLDNVTALYIGDYSGPSGVARVAVTMISDEERLKERAGTPTKVWTIRRKGEAGRFAGRIDREAREKRGLSELAPDTPEAAAAIKVWADAHAAERAATEVTKAAKAAIPRLTMAMLGRPELEESA